MTDTTPEAVGKLITEVSAAVASAYTPLIVATLRAQAERIKELEGKLRARDRLLPVARHQARNDALREALDKVHKTDAGADEYANIPSDFAAGIEAACEDIEADILALIEGDKP